MGDLRRTQTAPEFRSPVLYSQFINLRSNSSPEYCRSDATTFATIDIPGTPISEADTFNCCLSQGHVGICDCPNLNAHGVFCFDESVPAMPGNTSPFSAELDQWLHEVSTTVVTDSQGNVFKPIRRLHPDEPNVRLANQRDIVRPHFHIVNCPSSHNGSLSSVATCTAASAI